MARPQIARLLAWFAAVGFFLAAALLLSSYSSIATSARQAPADVAPLVPALWLNFAIAMTVLGGIIAVAAGAVGAEVRRILFVVACFPIAASIVLFRFLGFGPPAAILLVVGVLALAAAITRRASMLSNTVAAA